MKGGLSVFQNPPENLVSQSCISPSHRKWQHTEVCLNGSFCQSFLRSLLSLSTSGEFPQPRQSRPLTEPSSAPSLEFIRTPLGRLPIPRFHPSHHVPVSPVKLFGSSAGQRVSLCHVWGGLLARLLTPGFLGTLPSRGVTMIIYGAGVREMRSWLWAQN